MEPGLASGQNSFSSAGPFGACLPKPAGAERSICRVDTAGAGLALPVTFSMGGSNKAMADRRSTQRGDSKLGCVLWLLLLGVAVMVGWKMIPLKISAAELEDFMSEQAKFAAGASEETLKRRILDKAGELNLPVRPQDVTVSKANERIRMRVVFTIPVEFPGYTYEWNFDLNIDRQIFIF